MFSRSTADLQLRMVQLSNIALTILNVYWLSVIGAKVASIKTTITSIK